MCCCNTPPAGPTADMTCVNDLLEERAAAESTNEYFDSRRLDVDLQAIPCATGSVCEGDEERSVCTSFNGTGAGVHCNSLFVCIPHNHT